MALDLFVNFERSSNSSMFYRPVAPQSFSAYVKLSDQQISNFVSHATTNYIAQYSINNVGRTTYSFASGFTIYFDRQVPSVSSVQVHLSSSAGISLSSFSLSSVFVSSLPVADFIAYPSSYFDELSCTQNSLTSATYLSSLGLYFYGEGHTEVINLSTSSVYSGVSATWLIGNPLSSLETSNYSVSAVGNTATVSISSRVLQNEKIPIHLRLTTDSIKTNGPIITYDDSTGEKSFYSFFNSSLTPTSQENSLNTNLKSSIHVRPYPFVSLYEYTSPFLKSEFNLPYDLSNQEFNSFITQKQLSSIVTQRLDTTTWELDTVSRAGDWNWSKQLKEITIYKFPLGYDLKLKGTPDFLKISSQERTAVVQSLTAKKIVQLDYPPYDWLPSTQTETFSSGCTILPIPYIKPYIPNFLNLRNEDVNVQSIEVYADSTFVLKQVTFEPEDGISVTLSGTQLNQPFSLNFDMLGLKSLTAYSVFYNQSVQENQTIVNVFPDAVRIVDAYDDETDADLYRSADTPLTLSLTSVPLVSPNEWAVEDNINSIIEKFYNLIEQVKDYTLVYDNASKFYGWLGNPIYAWSDVECPPNNVEEVAWKQHEVCTGEDKTAGYPIFWLDHECEKQVGDPSCLQKYCLEWKWKTRKRSTSDILITWKESKASNQYSKKWKYESCEIDSKAINCDKGKWHISTVDPEFFPIPFCLSKPRCVIKGIIRLPNNQMVVAHSTELNLLDETYQSNLIARRGIADEIYSFVNIAAIDQTKDGKICVLDSTIPRVCIYELKDNTFRYFNSWGRFGFKKSLYGFNKPKDLHLNQNDQIVITDSGNKCFKIYSSTGRHIRTVDTEGFSAEEPLSVCQDSQLNFHVLFSSSVAVYDSAGTFLFEYQLNDEVSSPSKITISYNREVIYITHSLGVVKYFRTGTFFEHLINNFECADGTVLTNFNSIHQDSHRNVIVAVEDKVLNFVDRMELVYKRAPILPEFYWDLNEVKIDKEEYIQSWVYLKSFHRLWDNIELLRNALFYKASGCKAYNAPTYSKNNLVVGQNEIVTNAVVNRLSMQLWTNLQSLIKYFDPTCEK